MKNPKDIKPGTIYLCGPITGLPNNNFEAFARVQEKLDAENVPNVNPHELFNGIDTKNFTHGDYMKHCISHLAFCDMVVTLKGWEQSIGATMEVRIARDMGKKIIHENVLNVKQLIHVDQQG